MGGLLSGNPNCRKHDSTANRIRLDSFMFMSRVHELRETGKEIAGLSVKWERGDSIAMFIYADKIRLAYKLADTDKRFSTDCFLSFEPNRYGGRDRVYFICPECGRRVRHLYRSHSGFACRTCASLTYPSQRVTKGNDQYILKLKKAAAKLIPDAWSMAPMDLEYARPDKPKWMRWATYYRHRMALHKAQQEYMEDFISTAKRRFGITVGDKKVL